MLKDRNELEIEIKLLFKLYEANRGFYNELMIKTNNKMDGARLSKYWNTIDNSPVILTDLELCLLAKVSAEMIKERIDTKTIPEKIKDSVTEIQSKLKIEKWFTESEIVSMNAMYFEEKVEKNESDVVVFPNTVPFNQNAWLTVVSYGELISIMKTSNIAYNFNTQRDPVVIEKYGLIIYQQFVYKKRVDEMTEKMINGNFENNMITFNILDNGSARFTPPTEKDHSFYFFKDQYSVFNCIDGYHRSLAIQKAVSEKPELANTKIALKLTFYTVPKAQNLIKQECISTDQHISKARQAAFENNATINVINKINKLNTPDDNFLYEKISTTSSEVIKLHLKFVTFDIFKLGLEDEFDDLLIGGFQNNRIAKYLVEFFNVVGYVFEDDFKNILESQKKNIKTSNNTFFIYLLLARRLYGVDNWEDKLIEILNKIDWSLNNKDWYELKMYASNFGKKRRDTIKKYVESKNYFID